MGFYPELRGVTLQAYKEMMDSLKATAMKELKLGAKEIVTRALRPEDIGMPDPKWEFNIPTADAWNIMVDNKAIEDNRFVGINGIFYPVSATQAVNQIEIVKEGTTARYWHIQGINNLENATVYVDDPITIDQNTTITIRGYAVAASTETICFLGGVAERRGLLINP